MSRPFRPPAPESVAAIRALSERRLSPEELDAYVNAPVSDEERRAIQEQIAWFRRRYPNPLDRLASARRAYARISRRAPRTGAAQEGGSS